MAVSNQSSQNTRLIIALILIIVSIVGIFFFLIPKKTDFEESNDLLAQSQTELNRLKTQLIDLQEVEKSFEGSEVTRKDILNLIPADINQDGIINALSEIAANNQTSINSVSFSTGAGRDLDVQVVTINLNVTGTHDNLIRFLEGIENSSRKFRVKTISLQILASKLENMSITLEAFYL